MFIHDIRLIALFQPSPIRAVLHRLRSVAPIARILVCLLIIGCMFISLTGSATAQGVMFLDPVLPNDVSAQPSRQASRVGDESLRDTIENFDAKRSYSRFGLSPHLTASQAVDLDVKQSGSSTDFSLPAASSSETPAVSPKSAADDEFPPIQIRGSEPDDSQLESIDAIESQADADTERLNQDQQTRMSRLRPVGNREIIIQRYPDGKPKIEREVAQDEEGNFFNDGFWRVKSQAGKIIAEGQYRSGVMHGSWQRQHTSESSGLFATKPFSLFQGPFLSSVTFQNGKLDGIWTLTDAYQRKIFEIPYRNGKRHGIATWWYPSLNKMREVTFKDGLLDGKLLEWDEQDKLTRDEEFYAGKRVVRNVTFFRPKQKKAESFFLDAKLETKGEDNWWDAEPAPLVTVGDKVQHGPAGAWYDNGLPQMKGQYAQGKRVGLFSWWHSNGNKELEGSYDEGKKSGRWIWWHENGMKAIEGQYDNDQPTGVWQWWEESGKLESKEDLSPQNIRSENANEVDSETYAKPPLTEVPSTQQPSFPSNNLSEDLFDLKLDEATIKPDSQPNSNPDTELNNEPELLPEGDAVPAESRPTENKAGDDLEKDAKPAAEKIPTNNPALTEPIDLEGISPIELELKLE